MHGKRALSCLCKCMRRDLSCLLAVANAFGCVLSLLRFRMLMFGALCCRLHGCCCQACRRPNALPAALAALLLLAVGLLQTGVVLFLDIAGVMLFLVAVLRRIVVCPSTVVCCAGYTRWRNCMVGPFPAGAAYVCLCFRYLNLVCFLQYFA